MNLPRPLQVPQLLVDVTAVDAEASRESFTGKITVTIEWDYKDGTAANADWVVQKKRKAKLAA